MKFPGEISLFNILDYEKQQMVSVEIEATDGGANSLSSFCTFVLYVDDINDCSPVISPNHIVVHVAENSRPRSALVKVH